MPRPIRCRTPATPSPPWNKDALETYADGISAWIWTSASRSIRWCADDLDCLTSTAWNSREPRRTPRQVPRRHWRYDSSVLVGIPLPAI